MSEPIRLEVVRWKCPACSKSFYNRLAAVRHMERCWRRPENRGCRTCGHADGPNSDFVTDCSVGVDLTARPCENCGGDGGLFGYPCAQCSGTGIVKGDALPIVRCPLWVASDDQ
jgi:DnaJ-class molecular chaperone